MSQILSIQKFLQTSGVDSRREIRKNILEGYAKINNQIIKDPNIIVNIQSDVIHYRD